MHTHVLSSGSGNSVAPALFIIGGAADTCLADFARLAGASQAHVLIIPHASGAPRQAADNTSKQLKDVGIFNISVCMPRQKLEIAPATTAIFMTGGDQNRLVRRLSTADRQVLTAFYRGGGLVAGTSAGAAAMSEIMIAGGMDGGSSAEGEPKSPLLLHAGLGLCGKIVVDTHFSQRGRFQRPIVALAMLPDHIAIGLDEDTAVLVRNGSMAVFGAGKMSLYRATSGPGHFAVATSEYEHGSSLPMPSR